MRIHPVEIAVIGCGKISSVYLRNLQNLFYITDAVAVCDVDHDLAQRQAQRYHIERVLTLEEVLANPNIEMVVVLTGPIHSYDVIQKALNAGKHVFTEKVLALDLVRAQELMRLAREKGLFLGVAPDTVLGAGVQTAKKFIDGGMIGTVTSCLTSINRNHSLNSEEFRFIRTTQGAAFPYDIGIYNVAAMLCLMGPVQLVSGMTAPAPEHMAEHLQHCGLEEMWQIPGVNLMAGTIQFANGAIGSLHFNGNSVNEQQDILYIFGTEGIIKLGQNSSFGGPVTLIRAETGECVVPHTHGYNGKPVLEGLNPSDEANYGHRGIGIAEMAWAIRNGRPCRCGMEFGYHTLEVLHGIEKSAKTGQAVPVTSTFEFPALPSGYLSTMFHGWMRGDAERSLM